MIGSTAIIIDDKLQDGLAVAKTLWSRGCSCLYYEYNVEKQTDSIKKHSGVRIIFQDICLISTTSPQTTDYDAAVNTIDSLLAENNGPWLLAIWSTWEETHANELFLHLKQYLPDGKKPFSFVCLGKENLSEGGPHGAVKENPSDEELNNFYNSCVEKVSQYPSFAAVASWENTLSKSAHKIVNSLSLIPMKLSPENFDHALGKLLNQIAISEIGANFNDEEKSKGISRVLNNLASNQSHYTATIDRSCLRSDALEPEMAIKDIGEWARRTNFLLHIEDNNIQSSAPGMVYKYKKPKHYYLDNGEILGALAPHYSENAIKDLLLDELNRTKYSSVLENSKPILIDITPPCDHAQKKAQWRKFLIGLEISVALTEFDNKFESQFRSKSRWKGPLFSSKTEKNSYEVKFIYSDMRLVMSIPDHESFLNPLEKIYAIKEQLLREVVSTLSSHIARPGIVDLTR